MRLCFIGAALLALAASAAAGGPDLSSANITSVVRSDPRTGRLVRVMAAPRNAKPGKPQSAAWKTAAEKLDRYVKQTAERYEVDPALVDSVIRAESAYNPFAVSPKGAQGLMQLMPATARRLSVRDTFNPLENIDGGVRYLKYLLTLYGDRPKPEHLALAAYNAGEGAVFKYGGVPPYRETTQYVNKVVHGWQSRKAAEPPPAVERKLRVVSFIDSRGVQHIQTRYEP